MKKIGFIVFVVALASELLLTLMNIENFHYVAKPLIMLSLGFYYAASTQQRSGLIILAITASLIGDVLLLWPSFFMIGLIAFLCAHVFYIFAYRQHRYEETKNMLAGVQRIRLAFPVILAGTGFVIILYPVLGDLKIPVIVYAFVLVVMVLTALFRFGRTNSLSFWMVFSGALLFFISDGLLAINKFLQLFSYSDFVVMFTYGIAQFLIIQGLLKHQQ
jgi:uncharacterized membrane protein YhhN